MPPERIKGDALKLIIEIASVCNWRQPSDDGVVQFLKQQQQMQAMDSNFKNQGKLRSNKMLLARNNQINKLLAVKTP